MQRMILGQAILLALTMVGLPGCGTNQAAQCPAWGCDPCPYERISDSSWVNRLRSERELECPSAPSRSVRVNPRAGYVNKCTEEIAEHGHPAPDSMPMRLAVTLDPQRSTDELSKFMGEANQRYPRPSGQSMSDQEEAEIEKHFALPESSYSSSTSLRTE